MVSDGIYLKIMDGNWWILFLQPLPFNSSTTLPQLTSILSSLSESLLSFEVAKK